MAFKGGDSKFSIATTVTLVLAVVAVVLVKEPLKSSRPVGKGTELNGTTSELKVRARLWEDPFAAVRRGLDSRKNNEVTMTGEGTLSHAQGKDLRQPLGTARMTMKTQMENSDDDGLGRLEHDFTQRAQHGENISVLVVMTAGGPYADESESRIKDRYAVVAALDVGCFAPEGNGFLSYFTWRFQAKPVATPYEWYGRSRVATCGTPNGSERKEERQQVLVLWVRAEDYQGKILKGINELLRLISGFRNGRNMTVKVLGPRYSTQLQSMLLEIQNESGTKHKPFSWPTVDGKLELYSPWATAMPSLLSYGMKGKKDNTDENHGAAKECDSHARCDKVFHELLSAAALDVRYSIDSDKVLFESLFQELDRRQVTIGKDRIILIGEWDSFYARALPITFSAAACHYVADATIRKIHPPADQGHGFEECATTEGAVNALMKGSVLSSSLHIRRYSYLSGLDGETLEDQQQKPTSKKGDQEKDKSEGSKLKLRDIAAYEKPEGTSQLDYVRRLVLRIRSEEHEGVSPQYGKVKAIGIFGIDPYDTLLILQAVREQFPTVLFFTTDLDARYFHESEQKWTRNLLIVSHFGLQLDRQLQQAIPPFRNTYQTSAFLAVLQAIGYLTVKQCEQTATSCYMNAVSPNEAREYSGRIPPRLYEVGRQGAVDLSLDASRGSVHLPRTDLKPGERYLKFPDWSEWIGVTLFVAYALFVWSYDWCWNWLTARDQAGRTSASIVVRLMILLLPIVAAFALWLKFKSVDYAADEPFSWFDGVSIWPTELLRLLAGLLCLWFLFKARADSVGNTKSLRDRFSRDLKSDNGAWSEGFWSNVDWMFHGSRSGQALTTAALWNRYCRAHSGPQRVGRVALLFAIYLAIIMPIWWMVNDGQIRLFVPCRGEFNCAMDLYVTRIGITLLIVLNLSVLDSVLLCARWISETSLSSGLSELEKIRLIVERTRIVNRWILYPFLVLFIVVGARSHYFDNWDFPPALIIALMANSLVALASACLLYLAAVAARRHVLAPIQEQLDRSLTQDEHADSRPAPAPSSDRLRQIIGEIDAVQQGAFVPFYQQPVVQATLVAALAFLQYWYLGQ